MMLKLSSCLLVLTLFSGAHLYEITYDITETEMFSVRLTPNMFNWTEQLFSHQFLFKAALASLPDIMPWMNYKYSLRHAAGFLYGTAPIGTKSPYKVVTLCRNYVDYTNRKVHIVFNIHKREKVALREIEMKIDNFNVEDLLNEDRMNNLKDIYRKILWPESSGDLYTTLVSSAVDMGARLPLKPTEWDGVVVRFGSRADWSPEIRRVREEVRPLSRLSHCPRDYKRTSVERHFRDQFFLMDWCNFYLYNTVYNPNGSLTHTDYLTAQPAPPMKPPPYYVTAPPGWYAPQRADLPSRNYLIDFLTAVVAPAILAIVFVAVLIALYCLQYSRIAHKSKINERLHQKPLEVVTTEPSQGLSVPGPKPPVHLSGESRPQPPPYLGGNKRPHTDTTRNLALEETIKLLNQATIPNYKVIDYADGCDDYVPIKPDETGYMSMEPDNTGYAVLNGDVPAREIPI